MTHRDSRPRAAVVLPCALKPVFPVAILTFLQFTRVHSSRGGACLSVGCSGPIDDHVPVEKPVPQW